MLLTLALAITVCGTIITAAIALLAFGILSHG
jgi:hypothetical protein